MRKVKILIISIVLSLFCLIPISASDSASVSGSGFTLYGSINDSILTGSATGTYSSSTYVEVWGSVLCANDTYAYTGYVGGSPYVSVSYRNYGSYPFKWYWGQARAKLNNTSVYYTTRRMYN